MSEKVEVKKEREEIIFKTSITKYLEGLKNRAIVKVLDSADLVAPIDKVGDRKKEKFRKILLDEMNDYHRFVCEVVAELFEKAVD